MNGNKKLLRYPKPRQVPSTAPPAALPISPARELLAVLSPAPLLVASLQEQSSVQVQQVWVYVVRE